MKIYYCVCGRGREGVSLGDEEGERGKSGRARERGREGERRRERERERERESVCAFKFPTFCRNFGTVLPEKSGKKDHGTLKVLTFWQSVRTLFSIRPWMEKNQPAHVLSSTPTRPMSGDSAPLGAMNTAARGARRRRGFPSCRAPLIHDRIRKIFLIFF